MSESIDVAFAFLGGTILSVQGGYRVLQHPKKEKVFNRLADARWFLAAHWCDQVPAPAGILTHDGQVTFQNQAALSSGNTPFLPLQLRKAIFNRCLTLMPGEVGTYAVNEASQVDGHQLEFMGLEIDPRYGRVALVRVKYSKSLTPS